MEKSLDGPVKLPGDDDDDEPTDERLPHIKKSDKNGEIHDALTALKTHPPELMDDDVRQKLADRPTGAPKKERARIMQNELRAATKKRDEQEEGKAK